MKKPLLFLCILLHSNQVLSECGYGSCPSSEAGYINVHIVPHTHDDVGWLKTVDQYYYGHRNNIQRAGVQYIIDSVIAELLEDPARRFIYVESAFFWRWWGEQDLTMKETVRELVNDGRLEFISGGWSMNDEAAAHYSAIIDNLAIGIKFLQEEFGSCGRPKIGWQIDPFGHSREYANIMAKLGFDGLFFGRIDYADKDKRVSSKSMEMMWKAGEGGEEGEIFTGILYNQYQPPPGFCFDVMCNEVIMDNKLLEDYNLDQKLEDFKKFARGQVNAFATSNIFITMGGDFHYQDANTWYKNLDKLIKYMNEGKEEHKFNLFYSTPSCYLKSVREEIGELPTKTDDFFPYASDPHAYWTGYFTSRPALKVMIRKANSLLQACKQVESRNSDTAEDPRLMISKHSVSVNQHHDAVTGTAKQHVTDDYYLGLHRGMQACHQIISDGLKEQNPGCVINEWCPSMNISQCSFTESRESFTTSVYNPNPRTQTFYIRLPVTDNLQYSITDSADPETQVSYQLNPIPESVLQIPGREGKAKYELVFVATIPGLQNRQYLIHKSNKEYTGTRKIDLSKSGKFRRTSFVNKKFKLEVKSRGEEQQIKIHFGDLEATMGLYWYEPAVAQEGERASGAYIFRPKGSSPVPIGDPTVEVYEGSLYDEYHMYYNEWISLIFRQYKNQEDNFGEVEWLVGPIPVQDGGKEIIIRYDTKDVNSGDVFYTDSNGRGLIKRTRDFRETWELNVTEPISANYYPINTRVGIRDETNELWVMTDRSEGATSMKSGQIEIMLHRRLLFDDGFGVGEPLDEMAYSEGLVVRGVHRVLLCGKNCELESNIIANNMFAQPIIQFGEPCSHNRKSEVKSVELPKSVKLLTMEKYAISQILVRLENVGIDGAEISVNMMELFPNKQIVSVEARSLDGNIAKSDMKRMNWTTSNSTTNYNNRVPRYEVINGNTVEDSTFIWESLNGHSFRSSDDFIVDIKPGFVETYLVILA